MKTHYSNPNYAKVQAKHSSVFPPAIPHKDSTKKAEKKSEDKEKDKLRSFSVNVDEDNEVEIHIRVYEGGCPEDFCNWYEE